MRMTRSPLRWWSKLGNNLEIIASKVIECLKISPKTSISALAEKVGAENKDIKRTLQRLRDAGLLVREGAKRNGSWRVVGLEKLVD